MTIQDLRLGDRIYFGSCDFSIYGSNFGTASLNDILWVKVDENNTFLAYSFGARMCLDELEWGSSNPYRRASGSVFFPESNLFQWLNKRGEDWFVSASDGDSCPSYNVLKGFLSSFDDYELSLILPHQIEVAVPEGFRQKYGKVYRTSCLVSIPALSEVVSREQNPYEGKRFSLHSPEIFMELFQNSWTRTAASRSTVYFLTSEELSRGCPRERKRFNPKICLKGNALISDTPSLEGIYEVLNYNGSKSPFSYESLYDVLS